MSAATPERDVTPPAGPASEDRSRELVRLLLARKGIRLPGAGGGLPPRPADAPRRLSYPQQRLWFLHQLDPASAAYNLSASFRLSGPLDVRALEAALAAIVDRHDALRTTFHAADGEGVYEVAPAIDLPIVREDLERLAPSARAAAIDRVVARTAGEPFDLSRGPLIRVSLIRIDPGEHVLVLAVHHIVFDGWSIDLFVRELGEEYAARVEGRPPALARPSHQYQDFAYWQRSRADAPDLRAQRAYWTRRLTGLAPIDLPTDRRRPSRPSLRGDSQTFVLPAPLTAGIREQARQLNATPFMVLLAGFFVLLHRYTGREDLAVGSPIANRGEVEFEGVIGLFANTIVLRADLAGRPTFAELVARVRALTLEAYQHQDVPFEQLVEALQPERDTSRQPLFQVAFALQHQGIDRLQLPGLALDLRPVASTASKFDLTLALTDGPETIAGSVEYCRDLFDHATIARMTRHYEALLASAVREPASRIGDLAWSDDTTAGAAGGDRSSPAVASARQFPVVERLHERFARQAAALPDAVAVCCEDDRLTYAELDARANRLAHYLRRDSRIGPEARVGLFLERSTDMVVAILGVLKTGAAYVPIDPASPADRVGFIAADAGLAALLTRSSLRSRVPPLDAAIVVLDDEAEAIGRQPAGGLEAPGCGPAGSDVGNLAYVIYTSGSTGRPKGVLIQHDHVQRLFLATDRWFDFGPADVWTLFHSYGFDFSVWEIWGALLYGGRLVVVPYLVSRSPDAFHRLLVCEQVTVLNQTPSAFTQLTAADAHADEAGRLALRWVIFGGEALDLESLRPWFARHGDRRPRLVNMYGITETTVHVTFRPVTQEDVERGAGSVIGEAIPDLTLYLCDDEMRLVPPGVPGELFVGGAGVARGYLGQPGLTAVRFVPDPFSGTPGARLYRSGDRARWRASGDLEYLGRLDDQVKIRGFRIELGEIESALTAHDMVHAAVVVARRDGGEDRRLAAYVVPAGDAAPTRAELRRWLADRLPDYMLPSAFVMLPALPLTTHGKVDRQALPAPEHERIDDEAFVEAATPDERTLAAIWAEVLEVDRVGVADNFFALGGDSIRAIKVVARARERGLGIALPDLFQHQTIRALAGVVSTGAAPEASARTPFSLVSDDDRARLGPDVEDAYPLTLLQRGMLFHSRFTPGSAAYHNVSSFHLRLRFQRAAFEAAVADLLSRHAVFRTSFNLTDYSEPLQIVHRQVAPPLSVEDISHLDAGAQEAWLEQWFRGEQDRHFDWAVAPLLRLHVHRRAEDRLQLTLSEHHAILDGWSVATLLTELMGRYLQRLEGAAASPDPAPAVTFADYVAEEIAVRTSTDARAFWSRRMADAPAPALSIPSAGLRGGTGSAAAVTHRLTIPPEIVPGLEQVARLAGAPLKTTLLAAHMKVVGVLSHQRDVVSGLVVNARPEGRDSERVLGLFLNTVPFRIALGGASWVEFVGRTFAAEQSLLPYRGYPLAELQRILDGRTLFQAVFNFVHFHVYRELASLPSLALIDERSVAETSFPLGASFSLDTASGRLALSLEAASGRVDRPQLEALGDRYVAVLAAMAAGPHRSPDESALLLESERRQIVGGWANTPAPPVDPPLAHRRVAAHARARPGAVAVRSDRGDWTHERLERRVREMARELVDAGAGRGALVAICSDPTPDLIAAMLAVLRVGAAFVPVDPGYPAERVRVMIEDAAPVALLTDRDAVPGWSTGPVLRLDRHVSAAIPGAPGANADAQVDADAAVAAGDVDVTIDADDLAYVIYTSGSTGRPKGVMVRHGGLANLCEAQIRRFALNHDSRTLLFASISFDAAVSEIFTTLGAGAALHLVPRDRLRSPAGLVDTLRGQAITVVTLPPTLLAAVDAADLPALQTVVSAGEACSASIVRRWAPGRRFLNAYGPTEASVCATMTDALAADTQAVTIGKPIEGVEVHVLDASMQPVPAGITGDLFVAGAGLARGYLRRPDLTADRFVPHPFSRLPGRRLYRTGDLARWRDDGSLEFLGRADHQVKVRGVRLELDEVAAALRDHADVRDAVAIVREDSAGPARLVAYVVARPGAAPAVEALRTHLADRLPEQAVPSTFVMLDALPLTASGKIDRQALPDPGTLRPSLAVPYVAPRSDVESRLADVWARALGIAQVGVDDDFFSLGGDSIVSLQVVARAQAVGLRITPEQVFQHPTVAALARVARDADQRVRPARPDGPVALTPIQRWFFDQRLAVPSHWNQALLLATRRPIDVRVLQRAFDAVCDIHDALRLRFHDGPGGWVQHYDATAGAIVVEEVDLSPTTEADRSAAIAREGERLQRGLDLASGPLLRAAVLRLGAGGDRLLVVAHHIVVDGVSWRILIEDLQQALDAVEQGRAPALPPSSASYQEWAAAIAAYADRDEVRSQRPFWTQAARHAASVLPVDFETGADGNLESTARQVDAHLDADETTALLREVPPVYGTQINDALLAALVDSLAAWTGDRTALVDLEGHGREPIDDALDVSRTVGWFTTLHPMRLDLRDAREPGAALKAIKEQLRAVPQKGIGYGLLRYLGDAETRTALEAPPTPPISFNYLGQLDAVVSNAAFFAPADEPHGPMRAPEGRRAHLIDVVAAIVGGRLRMTWIFSSRLHRPDTIERLADDCLRALRDIVAHCRDPRAGGYTPSDFPQMDFDAAELDALMSEIDARTGEPE